MPDVLSLPEKGFIIKVDLGCISDLLSFFFFFFFCEKISYKTHIWVVCEFLETQPLPEKH